MLKILIHNDGAGTSEESSYDFSVFVNHEKIYSGHISGHNRQDGWPALLCLIGVQSLIEQANMLVVGKSNTWRKNER